MHFIDDLEWIERAHGALTYRITQLLTGHRVFESYLYRIGHRGSPVSLFCRAANDTAVHTLLFCPAWAEQRMGLLPLVGINIDDFIRWPNSPDLTLCDYFLWSYVKGIAFATEPTTPDNMQNRIRNAMSLIPEEILRRTTLSL